MSIIPYKNLYLEDIMRGEVVSPAIILLELFVYMSINQTFIYLQTWILAQRCYFLHSIVKKYMSY